MATEELAAKRARTGDWGAEAEATSELSIPQQFVGWLKGKNGCQIIEIERRSGATVNVDQSTKDSGFSRVLISGKSSSVQVAADAINDELKRVMDRDSFEGRGAGAAEHVEEVQVPQRYVGWLKGSGGAQIREMEARSGAGIRIDQSTRDLGYSIAQISGSVEAVQAARSMVEEELVRGQERDRATGGHGAMQGAMHGAMHGGMHGGAPGGGPMELRIPQQYVGWIKGTGGAQIKDIEVRTAAQITIDQSTKDRGFSRALIYGSPPAVEAAREILEQEIQRVMSRDQGLSGSVPAPASGGALSDPSQATALVSVLGVLAAAATGNSQQLAGALTNLAAVAGKTGPDGASRAGASSYRGGGGCGGFDDRGSAGQCDTVMIPSTCIGWLKGRQGGMVREIEGRSGCQIDIEQPMHSAEHGLARFRGSPSQQKLAHGLVVAEVAKVLDQSNEMPPMGFVGTKSEFSIDTQYVGWVKGPRGKVVQEIQLKTGTRVDVDQSGGGSFAIVKVFGTNEGVAQARVEVAAELSKINPEAAEAIVAELPGGLEMLRQAIDQAKHGHGGGQGSGFGQGSGGSFNSPSSFGQQPHRGQSSFGQGSPVIRPAPFQVRPAYAGHGSHPQDYGPGRFGGGGGGFGGGGGGFGGCGGGGGMQRNAFRQPQQDPTQQLLQTLQQLSRAVSSRGPHG